MSENPLKIVYQQCYSYFTDTLARMVLFFAICAAILLIFLAALVPGMGTSALLIFAFVVVAAATAYDTWEQRKKYKAKIEATEMDYFTRIAEASGDKAAMEADGVFGEKEKEQIRRKLRDYRLAFIVKLVFLAILVILLINLL